MWSAVSAAHRELARHRSYYLDSAIEDRLGEQLSLIPMLQDWRPATEDEAADLIVLLEAWVDTAREDVAVATVGYIRAMAGNRARGGYDLGAR